LSKYCETVVRAVTVAQKEVIVEVMMVGSVLVGALLCWRWWLVVAVVTVMVMAVVAMMP
jgi:hypothetical protein